VLTRNLRLRLKTIDASQVAADMGIGMGVHVRVVKGAIILEGSVKNPDDSKRAENLQSFFAPQVLISWT